jgi:NAD(P)-dependent dehydrogenase (short-subunit alcohol dehydrogenase family)
MQRFNNKFALITGGTSGMEFATAQQFINKGGKVIITGRSAETVNEAVEKLGTNAFGIVSNAGNMIDIIPFKRFGEPLEIAHAVLFLASQEASYIHGTEVTVDAGISVLR